MDTELIPYERFCTNFGLYNMHAKLKKPRHWSTIEHSNPQLAAWLNQIMQQRNCMDGDYYPWFYATLYEAYRVLHSHDPSDAILTEPIWDRPSGTNCT